MIICKLAPLYLTTCVTLLTLHIALYMAEAYSQHSLKSIEATQVKEYCINDVKYPCASLI